VASYVRKVKTSSGATAVQIVVKRGGVRQIVEHLGSAHDDVELAVLLQVARERLAGGQDELDLGLRAPAGPPSARVVSSSCRLLWQVLTDAYRHLGFDVLGDEAFRAMVLARLVEPTSKADTGRVLEELGVPAVHVNTLHAALRRSRERDYRGRLATACLAHSARTTGRVAMVLYDVTTLHFENADEDDLRRVGMSKEHRVDPQVQVGLLVDPGGFPLEVHLFEGNKAETTTLIPVLTAFGKRHGVTDMVVVADTPGCSRRPTSTRWRTPASRSSSARGWSRRPTTWPTTSNGTATTSPTGRSWSPRASWAPDPTAGLGGWSTSGGSPGRSAMTARST